MQVVLNFLASSSAMLVPGTSLHDKLGSAPIKVQLANGHWFRIEACGYKDSLLGRYFLAGSYQSKSGTGPVMAFGCWLFGRGHSIELIPFRFIAPERDELFAECKHGGPFDYIVYDEDEFTNLQECFRSWEKSMLELGVLGTAFRGPETASCNLN